MDICRTLNTIPQVGGAQRFESHTDSSVSLMDSGGGRNSTNHKPRQDNNKFSKTRRLYIATYNIRTLRQDEHLERLEEELKHIKWDVLGLSETRLKGEITTSLKSGHLLYQNNSETKDYVGGVAILVNKRLKHKVIKREAMSDRVIYIVIEINKRYSLQIIQVYAPTSASEDSEVEQMYEDITAARTRVKAKYVIIMGDFNAKIGHHDNNNIPNIGRFGLGQRNSRGDILINYCRGENLYCMNSFFKKPLKRRWTWKSPNGSTKNEIDYIMTNKKTICEDITVLNRFDTNSDHRLVRAAININTRWERNKLIKRKPIPTNEILNRNREKFEHITKNKLRSKEDQENMGIDELALHINNTIQAATKEVCFKNKEKKSKISLYTKNLMERRRNMNRDCDEYREINREINKNIRKDVREHNTKVINDTIQDNKSMKVLRSQLARGRTKISGLKDKQGQLVSTPEEITTVVQDFYTELYSPTTQDLYSEKKDIRNVGSEEIPEIDNAELMKALSQMKNNKSPGEDRITAEMIKIGGEQLRESVRVLLNKCLIDGRIPEAWKNAEVILLYKKGDRNNVENYRPISILSHLYKLFTKIITNRLTKKLDAYQPPEQAAFRKDFSTIDHLYTVHTLIEKTTEYNTNLHLAFIDYQKAFDSIETWAVLRALDNARIDSRYSALIKHIYENAHMQVTIDEGIKTPKIPIKRGVRQGDTISPKLFTLALEDIFKSLDWQDKGINIDGTRLNHLRFADDIVILSDSPEQLKCMLQELYLVSSEVGLKMNLSKTKIMSPEQIQIRIENQIIENVREYIYLGHKIQIGKENQSAEIPRRVSHSWAAFGKLSFILKSNKTPLNLKRKVYESCILPVLTYGLETIPLTRKTINKLQVTQRAMERAMLGISLRDRIPNEEIRRRTKLPDVTKRVAQIKWRWAGHVARQDSKRWTYKITVWRPRENKRPIGRPNKRWRDDLQKIAGKNWMRIATDRQKWKSMEEAYIQEWMTTG